VGRAAAVSAAAAVAALGCAHPSPELAAPPSSPSRLLGQASPALRGQTVTGEPFDMVQAAGRVLVVEFFAAYCAPCRRSLPRAQALHRRRPEVAVLGVSLDETPGQARALARQYGLTFPVVHDGGHLLAGRFRVAELPASFVIDRQGRVAWAGGGDQPDDALPRAAERLLGAGR
jgi:cytochrome c biogenesis protein CcmG/thiol:disulfide interchange protein DsbE